MLFSYLLRFASAVFHSCLLCIILVGFRVLYLLFIRDDSNENMITQIRESKVFMRLLRLIACFVVVDEFFGFYIIYILLEIFCSFMI